MNTELSLNLRRSRGERSPNDQRGRGESSLKPRRGFAPSRTRAGARGSGSGSLDLDRIPAAANARYPRGTCGQVRTAAAGGT